MIFKELETDQDWSEAIRLRNIYNWSFPVALAESMSFLERTRKDRHDERFAGLVNGQIVTYGSVVENKNSDNDSYYFFAYFDPHLDGANATREATIQECMRRIKAAGGKSGIIESRGEYLWEKDLYARLEFQLDQRQPYSCLNTSEFDYSSHPEVVTFGEYIRLNPTDGLHNIWRLEMDIAADLPLTFPFVETPLEVYSRVFVDPEVCLDSKFLFEEGGELKGMSQLWPSKVNTTLAATGLTGVRRQYRRQNVATKTKQHAINWAKAQGIERIFTDNEENNPMYQLNLQLGFRHLFDYEVYSKAC